jgi:hypothetical protein
MKDLIINYTKKYAFVIIFTILACSAFWYYFAEKRTDFFIRKATSIVKILPLSIEKSYIEEVTGGKIKSDGATTTRIIISDQQEEAILLPDICDISINNDISDNNPLIISSKFISSLSDTSIILQSKQHNENIHHLAMIMQDISCIEMNLAITSPAEHYDISAYEANSQILSRLNIMLSDIENLLQSLKSSNVSSSNSVISKSLNHCYKNNLDKQYNFTAALNKTLSEIEKDPELKPVSKAIAARVTAIVLHLTSNLNWKMDTDSFNELYLHFQESFDLNKGSFAEDMTDNERKEALKEIVHVLNYNPIIRDKALKLMNTRPEFRQALIQTVTSIRITHSEPLHVLLKDYVNADFSCLYSLKG